MASLSVVADPGPTTHERTLERLWPSWSVWIFALVVAAGFGLVVAPFGGAVMAIVSVVMVGVLGGLLVASTPTVGVDGDHFVAGKARIPVHFLGPPEALDADGMRRARGPELDARAYLCMRGWVGPGLRVPVTDPADPVPYWLVSSRRPHEIAEAITRGRS
jgi:Protein of unknown function (DUF3093)